MRFCALVLIICFYYLILCQRFVSSRYLLSENRSSSIDNDNDNEEMFEKLYVYFNKHYLRKHEIRHVSVVGGTSSDLRRVHLIYEGYPRSHCTQMEKCFDPMKFNSNSLIIFFLKDSKETEFKKNIEFLSSCRNECKFIFISKGKSPLRHIIIEQSFTYVTFLQVETHSIRFYKGIFTDKCSLKTCLDFVWTVRDTEANLDRIHSMPSEKFNLKGCPVTVSTLRYMPKMAIEKNKDGKSFITGGKDGLMLLLIAEQLNFTIRIVDPPKYGNIHSSRKLGIIDQVATGKAEIGVGRLRPIVDNDNVVSSTPHDRDCITWAVPNIMSGIGNVFWSEYSWDLWALIGLVFFLSCVIGYTDRITGIRKKGERRKVDLTAIILDIFALNLGNPAIHLTFSTGGKLLLVAYLAYTTVITTGYKTSLNSALTTIRNKPLINDAHDIIAANLTLGGSFYYYQILMDQANASKSNRELTNRYVIYNDASDAIKRLKFGNDFALLDRQVDLNYLKSGEVQSSNFYTLDECVSQYYIVMVIRKGSLLLDPINRIIERFTEMGIWNVLERDEMTRKDQNTERLYAEYTRQILIGFSKFYCCALAFCVFVFFIELLIPRLKFKKKRHIVRHDSYNPQISN